MAATDPMMDALYQLQVPQQLVQRIISIESGARELESRTEQLGAWIPAEKAWTDNLIHQLENKAGPAIARLELGFRDLSDQIEEKTKASSDFANNLLQIYLIS